MRIAYFNTIRAFGGGEKRVIQGTRDLRGLGHSVTVFCRRGSALEERCRAEEVTCEPLEVGSYVSWPRAVQLRELFAKHRLDCVICFDQRAVRLAALAQRLPPSNGSGPAIVYYYGGERTFRNVWYNRQVVAPAIERYVPNAAALRDELLSFGWIPPERIEVIYDGLDPRPILAADPAGVREELGADPRDLVVITVARLVEGKGHDTLIRAAGPLLTPYPGLRLWLAGDGPLLQSLQELARSSGLGDRVQFLGFRKDVPRLLRAANILCHPSRKEGAPNAVREGMAAGLPVAAVAASGTPELIDVGETGYLSPIDDVPSLSANLARLLEDASLRARLGEAGKRKALAEFGEEICTSRWLTLLEGCSERRESSSRVR